MNEKTDNNLSIIKKILWRSLMLKKFFFLLLLAMVLIFSCKKNDAGETINNNASADNNLKIYNATQYVKENGVYVFTNESDVEKQIKDLDKDKYLYLTFGNKVNVVDSKKIGKDEYFKIQLPDTTVYWAKRSFFAEKLITINQTDVLCYRQPDLDYATTIKLQPGDFGIYVKELNDWICVEFRAYRPVKADGERKWVGGPYWIKTGYTDDIMTAKQAYYLYLAYYNSLIKNNDVLALENLNRGLTITNNEDTEITYVIRDMIREISPDSDTNEPPKDEVTDSDNVE